MAAIAALPACAPTSAPDAQWPRLDLGSFSLQLPREYVRREVQGIDSYVGRFDARDRTLDFDFGNFSNPLVARDFRELREYRACREAIGGHLARIVTARRNSTYFAGAAWRDVGRTVGVDHLTITLSSRDARAQVEAIQIFRSVHFP